MQKLKVDAGINKLVSFILENLQLFSEKTGNHDILEICKKNKQNQKITTG